MAIKKFEKRMFGLLCMAIGAVFCEFSDSNAQRHPESQGPLPYYRDEPGYLAGPEWLQRPPFVRGPRDRFERGANRMFLGTGDEVPYLNYADDRYILSQRELIPWFQPKGRPWKFRNTRWDRLGNYMGSTVSTSPASSYLRLFSWEETRSADSGRGRSFIDHMSPSPWSGPAGYTDATLRIGHYNYKDLHWTATVGERVRSIFTPLTLSQAHLSVARVDFDNKFGQDRATILFNRGRTRPGGLFSEWASVGGDTEDPNPVLMYGMHYKHRFGRYAQFGTTLLNQVMNMPSSGNSSPLKGDLPYEMLGPRLIRVFIADDSPEEVRHNARVYSVNIALEGNREDGRIMMTSSPGEYYDARLEPVVVGGRTIPGSDGREAVGRETVVYEFNIPSDLSVQSATFSADVSDDYRIGVRQVHDFPGVDRDGDLKLTESVWPDDFVVTEAGTRRPFKWDIQEDEEPYYTVVRSEGKGENGSNRKIVRFDHGIPTGQNLASLDFQANLIGLKFSGEVVRNTQNFIYPVGLNDGKRSSEKAWAYWVNVIKDLGPAQRFGAKVGAEVFRLDPNYSGGYDSQRGGMAFHLDYQDGSRVKSDTQEYGLVEDNDDDDQWPDDFNEDNASPGRMSYPGWTNASVYPGLDENLDNIPDVDRNENFIPDWEEPFLVYDADPPEFVYGIDFNNNGMPDFRENDDLPDYPYRKDQRGRHFFLLMDKLGKIGESVSLGYYKATEEAGGNKAESLYLRYAYNQKRVGIGSLKMNFDVKQVKDNIRDDSYVYTVPPNDDDIIPWLNKPDTHPGLPGRFRPATPDPLLMQDSFVATAFLKTDYIKIANTTISNSALWVRNEQAEITLLGEESNLQEADTISRIILVNKVKRNWLLGSLDIQAKFKHRLIFETVDSQQSARTSYSDFIPIAMAEYSWTPKTSFVLGIQGLPFLPYKRVDRAREDGSFDQADYAFMYKMQSEYFGFRNEFFFGYLIADRNYKTLKDRNFRRGTFFVEIITPF